MTSMLTGSGWARGFAAVSVIALAVATPARAQEAMHTFDIPAQPLSKAIAAFARQSRAIVLAPSALTRGKMSVAVKGSMSASEALRTLIGNSALSVTERSDGALLVSARQGGLDPKDSTAAADRGEDIVVTGSNIRGGNPESPVITITRKDIDRSGYSTAADLIKSLPQSSPGGQNATVRGSPFQNSGGNYGAISSANLRGLGADATLTLVDGRRLAYGGSFNGVDVSSIPFGAIERVEVLADGASSIYGSDAIGGVVNFILRKRFDGALTTARIGISTYGDGPEYQINQLLGTGWSSGSIMAAYEYYEQQPIFAADRPFSRTAAAPNSLAPEQKKHSGLLSFRQDLTQGLNLSVNGMYTDRRSIDDSALVTSTRQMAAHVRQYGISPQLHWNLGNWVTTLSADFSSDKESEIFTSIQRANGSKQLIDYNQNNSLENYEIQTSGKVFSIPGGDVKIAFGGGYRKEDFLYTIQGFSNSTIDASRSIRYGYAEVRVPLVSELNRSSLLYAMELSASGRYEDYSDFGTNFSPRLGASYKPTSEVSIRGTWARSFKAARLAQVGQGAGLQIYTATQLGVTAPAGSVIAIKTGGNRNLSPETAESYTVGIDYEPHWVLGLKLGITYFNLNYKDRIDRPFTSLIGAYSNPIYSPYIAKNVSAEQYIAVASSVNTNTSFAGTFSPSQVFAIYDVRQQNLFKQDVKGVDVNVNYSFDAPFAKISVFGNVSTLKIKTQYLPTIPAVTTTGTIFNPAKFRARGGFHIQGPVAGGGLIVNHTGPEIDNSNNFNTLSPAKDVPVSAVTTLDGQLTFGSTDRKGPLEGFQLSIAVQNLLNTKPPTISSTSGASAYPGLGYDSANYSAVGRYFSVTVAKRW